MKGRPIDRVHQAVLIASLLPLSWLGMMAVHEFGHVLGAWATGGTVTEVVLHPLAISRTDVRPNPRPLIVVWAGPLIGTLLPAAALAAAVLVRLPGAFLLRFFAGFCLIANGAYIGVGSLSGTGDAGVMLRHGSPPWALWLFGLAAVAAGLRLWHRLGAAFGLGPEGREVRPVTAWGVFALLVLVVIVTSL